MLPNGPDDVLGAKALEKLIALQRKRDRFDFKQAIFVKQALIMGLSPGKVSWDYRYGPTTKKEFTPIMGGGFQVSEVVDQVKECDQPTFTPVPVEDFLWDPSASNLDQAAFVCYRTWTTMEHLREMEAAGVYSNIDDLTENGGGRQDALQDTFIQRDRKNRIEIVEFWKRDRLIVLANRSVVIRDEPNLFWHGKLPFVVASPNPDLYSLEGLSDVDLVLDLQAARWELLNQTIDNTRLLNNAIIMARDTIDDPDKLKFAPGELWLVADPAEVLMWTPNHNVTTSALEMDERLARDFQDITGAIPYLSGAGEGSVDQNTATGINIIQSMAGKRIVAKRNMIYDAYREIGLQWIALNQQLLSAPERMRIETEEGFDFPVITPQDIQCECDYDIEDAAESLNRQQERQEALALWNAIVPQMQLLAQGGAPINAKEPVLKLLSSFDVKNPEAWLGQLPPMVGGQPIPGSGQVPPGAGQPAPGGQMPPIGPPAPPNPQQPFGQQAA